MRFAECFLDQSISRVDQERAKDVENPREGRDCCGANRDKDAAKNQCHHDSDQQRLALQSARHCKGGKDDQEDKQIVDRKALFGNEAGQVFAGELATPEMAHHEGKGKR